MIWPFKNSTANMDQAALALNPFIAKALSSLEEQVSPDHAKSRMLAECYICGAIRYLASYDGLNPRNTKELMYKMLKNHFNANTNEVDVSLSYLSDTKDGEKEQLFMIEGASALRRWLVNGDRNVTTDLKNLLDMHVSH